MSPTRVEVIPIPVDLSRLARAAGQGKWGRVTPNLKLPEQRLTEPSVRTLDVGRVRRGVHGVGTGIRGCRSWGDASMSICVFGTSWEGPRWASDGRAHARWPDL